MGPDPSKLLITNLNHFAQVSGYSSITRLIAMTISSSTSLSSSSSSSSLSTSTNIISTSTSVSISNVILNEIPKLSLSEVHSLVLIIKGISTHFSKKFCSNYLLEFQLAVARRLELINCDKDLRDMLELGASESGPTTVIELIWKDMGIMLRNLLKDFPFYERYGILILLFIFLNIYHTFIYFIIFYFILIETYQLFLSKVLMTSPYLNLRIRGISLLNEQIDKLRRKEELKQKSSSSASSFSFYNVGNRQVQNTNEPTLYWLTASYLANWMIENKIMELALGNFLSLFLFFILYYILFSLTHSLINLWIYEFIPHSIINIS